MCIRDSNEGLAVFHSYFGAPATVALAEALIAVGIKNMKKVLTYSKAGVLAVEMECSALFCLSTYRRTNSAALLIITDTLWEGAWKPAFNEPKVINMEKRISEKLATSWKELTE